MAGRLA